MNSSDPQTNSSDAQTSVKDKLGDIVMGFLEVYTGGSDSKELWIGWKFISALAGALTFTSFYTAESASKMSPSQVSVTTSISQARIRLPFVDTGLIEIMLNSVLIGSPFIIALLVAYSFERGKPLRFYLIGFFLISVLTMFVKVIWQP